MITDAGDAGRRSLLWVGDKGRQYHCADSRPAPPTSPHRHGCRRWGIIGATASGHRVTPAGRLSKLYRGSRKDQSLVTRLFRYRLASGQGLHGHSFGNLFITAMVGVAGSFESALRKSSEVLAVQGEVRPSTLETVKLCADIECRESALEQHLGKDVMDIVLVNSRVPRRKRFGDSIEWVKPDIAARGSRRVAYADLLDETQAGYHDSHKLARELRAVLN